MVLYCDILIPPSSIHSDATPIYIIEREMILERQREGIAIAKKEGRYKGRNKIVISNIEEYYNRYMTRKATKTQIAKELKISRCTLDRLFQEYKTGENQNGIS